MSTVSLALLAALLGGNPSLKVVPLTEDPLRVSVVAELPADQVVALSEGTVARPAGRQFLPDRLTQRRCTCQRAAR